MKKFSFLILVLIVLLSVSRMAMAATLTLPDGVTVIEEQAFYGDTSLDEVVLPEGIVSIGPKAFANSSIHRIYLPASLRNIAIDAFSNCEKVFGWGTDDTYASMFCDNNIDITFDRPNGLPAWRIPQVSAKQSNRNEITVLISASEPADSYDIGEFIDDEFQVLTTVTDQMSAVFTDVADGTHTYGVRAKKTVRQIQLESSIISTEAVTVAEEDSDYDFIVLNASRCALSGYHGNETSLVLPSSGCYGRRVSKIGEGAFKNKAEITEVTIPESVLIIDKEAFSGCSGLASIHFSSGLTTINESAFAGSGVREVNLPATLTNIRTKAFYGCASLLKVNAFSATGLKTINSYAFYNCSALEEALLPDSIETIKSSVFYHCSSLCAFRFPENLKSIGGSAFNSCSALAEIHLPNKQLSFIGGSAFQGCDGITGEVVIPDTVTSIGDTAFRNCYGITSVKLSSGLQTMGESLFFGCTGLKNVVIPDGVTSVSDYCFRDCTALENVVISQTVTQIGEGSFMNCKVLESIRLPSSIETIGMQAFTRCKALKSINIPDYVEFGGGAFTDCYALEEIHIPATITEIGDDFDYSGLKKVVIPNSVTVLDGAFYKCESLEEVVIPSSVTTIGSSSFAYCTSLKKIAIPSGVTTIGDNAFYSCSGLKRVELPASVTTFGTDAFKKCKYAYFYGIKGSPAQTYVENELNDDFYDITLPPIVSPTVTVSAVTSNSITVKWNSVNSAIKYWVYAGKTSSSLGGVDGPFTSERSYTWTDLEPNTTYYFWVTAANSNNIESSLGTPAHAKTGDSVPVTTAPAQPSPSFGTVNNNSIQLKWNKTENSDSYKIYYSTTSTKPLLAALTVDASTLIKTVTGLSAGTKYYFWVSANNANGETVSSAIQKSTSTISSGEEVFTVSHSEESLYDYADGTTSFQINMGSATSQGDQYTLTINSNQTWTVTSNCNWIDIPTDQQSGSGNGSVILMANSNTSYQPMVGSITVKVKGRTITGNINKPEWAAGLTMQIYHRNNGNIDQQIYQTQDDTPVYNNGITLGEGTGTTSTYTFYIESNFDWTLSTSGNWFSASPKSGTGGSSPTAVKLSFNNSITTGKHTGKVTILAGISQRKIDLNVIKPAMVLPGPGVPEAFYYMSLLPASVRIEWKKVDGADRYAVFYSTSSNRPTTPATGQICTYTKFDGDLLFIDLKNLQPNRLYYYWVAAYTADGGESISEYKTFNTPKKPTRIDIVKEQETISEITIGLNEKVQLGAKFTPENCWCGIVDWQSENANIVTVNNGLLIGKKVGDTTIRIRTTNGVDHDETGSLAWNLVRQINVHVRETTQEE